jgi:hypothetical protein
MYDQFLEDSENIIDLFICFRHSHTWGMADNLGGCIVLSSPLRAVEVIHYNFTGNLRRHCCSGTSLICAEVVETGGTVF